MHTALGHGALRTGEKTIHLLHSQIEGSSAEIVIDVGTGIARLTTWRKTRATGSIDLPAQDVDELVDRIDRLTPGAAAAPSASGVEVSQDDTGAVVLCAGDARATVRAEVAPRLAEALSRARDILSGQRTY